MTGAPRTEMIHTRIWREEAEAGNPFATRAAYCRGYDVFGEMLGNARWVEMLFLLFRDELPDKSALDALEIIAVALANPGPRDPAVHAAMCGGVGGSSAAASLMAALAVGAGRSGGAREVFDAMELWLACGTRLETWASRLAAGAQAEYADIWPPREHPPGFDPHGLAAATVVLQFLDVLVRTVRTPCLTWLAANRAALEGLAGLPLAANGVVAAALADLRFTPREGEMLHLLLRLPGAAAHALEQEAAGYKQFPFYAVELDGDPLSKEPK